MHQNRLYIQQGTAWTAVLIGSAHAWHRVLVLPRPGYRPQISDDPDWRQRKARAVAPLLRSDAWWIRVFDYPRMQMAVLMGLELAGFAAPDMRDAELLLVAKEVNKLGDVPVIVAGDFNDVAWSHNTHLFQRIGGLLDPRVGRGLFNTFDTGSRPLRFALDHDFTSKHFLLVELRRLPDIGSDHFPLLVVLDYDPGASVANEEPQPYG